MRWCIENSDACLALAAALSAAACGGVSERSTDGDGHGKGGANATGGANPTGGVSGVGGTAGERPCVIDGVVYPHGSSFPSADGCNTCFCSDGDVSCTLRDCPQPARCSEIAEEYEATLALAKQCDPKALSPCTEVLASGIACGCPTAAHVGPSSDALEPLVEEAAELGCGSRVTCGACSDGRLAGYCSAEGVCNDIFVPYDCGTLRQMYYAAFARAAECEPLVRDQCLGIFSPEPGCGCLTHVSYSNELRQLTLEWSNMGCENSMPCPPCPPPAPEGACGDDGRCVDVSPQ